MFRRRFCCLALGVLMTTLFAGHRAGATETWAQKLGYPSGKRVIILYASQMGMCYETNQAGKACLSRGSIQSAGSMPPCPWFAEFWWLITMSRENGRIWFSSL